MEESDVFEFSHYNLKDKLDNFPKYVRRQGIARFLARYELFKLVNNVKGSIIECGVHHGGGIMSFAKISASLEPIQIHRKIIGFDTFEGFPSRNSEKDSNTPSKISFKEDYDIYEELLMCVKAFDKNRFLAQYPKVTLVKGNAIKTIPEFINKNQHLIVALLFLDFDLYEPTKCALKYFLPRIPKGGLVCFDEINNPYWKGETVALLDKFDNLNKLRLKKFNFDPNISYAVIE